MNSEELIKEVLQKVQSFDVSDMPSIDLYMDQVTTYLNEKLKIAKRHDDDKVLTKTMINNYAKSHLLPPPEKKKYTKDHLLALISIFFFKNVISINDVTTILNPLLGEYFQNEQNPLEDVLSNFFDYIAHHDILTPILEEYESSIDLLCDVETDNREQLQTLSLIAILCYDMFVRKLIVEKLVDSLPKTENVSTEANEKPKDSNDKKKTENKKNAVDKKKTENKKATSDKKKTENKKATSDKKKAENKKATSDKKKAENKKATSDKKKTENKKNTTDKKKPKAKKVENK